MRVLDASKGRQREVIEYAFNLRNIAQLLVATTPGLLEATIGFDKLVRFINSLLHEMVKMSSELDSMLAKLEKVRSKCERLESSLQKEKENRRKYLSYI